MRLLVVGAFSILFLTAPIAPAQQRNVLLIVADDLGVDMVGAYAAHPSPARTPVIDALAAGGLKFGAVWANTSCSPARAAMLTGRRAETTGWGLGTDYWSTPVELPLAEQTIPERLPASYHSAWVGKWHLGSKLVSNLEHPRLQGFDDFRGSMTVLTGTPDDNYFSYAKVVNGVEQQSNVYATTDQVNDALELIGDFGNDPWFLVLAFHAPHGPFHKPPSNLHSYGILPNPIGANIPAHAKAMTEAMDTEMGRLFASMDPAVLANTVILFVGDNGTDKVATTAPYQPTHAKGTLYQGGVHVPLIMMGPGVPVGADCNALVNLTDLFATVLEVTGSADPSASDAISLVPYLTDPAQPSLRAFNQIEMFSPNGFGPHQTRTRVARDSRHKLMLKYQANTLPFAVEFYDLLMDPLELINLLTGPPLSNDQQTAYDALQLLLEEPYVAWTEMAWTSKAGSIPAPHLSGQGMLEFGEPYGISLTGTLPDALLGLVIGLDNYSGPLANGVLVTTPIVLSLLPSSPTGELHAQDTWPAGVPAGVSLFVQVWAKDPGATQGWAASNGLAATAP